jgi:glucose-6-phosphate 1-dehydrogenase
MHIDTFKSTVQYNQINDTMFKRKKKQQKEQIKTSISPKSQIQIKCSFKKVKKTHINNKIQVRTLKIISPNKTS